MDVSERNGRGTVEQRNKETESAETKAGTDNFVAPESRFRRPGGRESMGRWRNARTKYADGGRE